MTSIDTSDVATLRRLNAQTTLDCLRVEPTRWFTVRELADLTLLSRPTVSRVLDDLERAGWVHSVAGQPGATGRPARRYCFNGEAGLIVGIDAGVNLLNLVVTDLAGTQITEYSTRTPAVGSEADLVGVFLEAAHHAIALAEKPGLSIRAVTVGMPGPVDDDGVLRMSGSAPNWVGYNPTEGLLEAFPQAKVLIGRDIDFSTLAELTSGALMGAKTAVHVTFSDRCDASLIVDGEIVRGAHGLAGARPQPHGIGQNMSESWVGLQTAIYEGHPRQRMSEIIAAAQSGEQSDIDVLTAYSEALAPRVAFLMRALAPEVLVVGGQMMSLPEIALPPLQGAVIAASGVHHDSTGAQPRVADTRLAHYSYKQAAAIGGVYAALTAIDWTV